MTRAQGWARAAATVLVVLAADQVTKLLADGRIARGDSINVFFGLDLTNTRNRGVAFGFLEGKGGVVGALIAVALLALVVWFALNAGREWLWLPVGTAAGRGDREPDRPCPRGGGDRLHRPDRAGPRSTWRTCASWSACWPCST